MKDPVIHFMVSHKEKLVSGIPVVTSRFSKCGLTAKPASPMMFSTSWPEVTCKRCIKIQFAEDKNLGIEDTILPNFNKS